MKNTNESGRSMVEMLGVLAIIGVLSIGGIAGYTMAMNRYRANEIVNAVVQAAVECRTRGTFSENEITASGLTFSGTKCTKGNGVVGFMVTSSLDIARLVCKTLKPYNQLNSGTPGGPTTCEGNGADLTKDNFSAAQMYYMPTS
jgi:type II secretory pathway pseudopilin PulG